MFLYDTAVFFFGSLHWLVMAACKFTEAQVALQEQDYNEGLNSVSMKKFGDRIQRLAEKSGLEEEVMKTWINNRKRGLPPTEREDCFPSASQNNPPSEAKKVLKAPPVCRQPSGYNLFTGELISNGK